MNSATTRALDIIAERGSALRKLRLPWSPAIEHAVARLRLETAWVGKPWLVAIVGGASSGKSTLFNNLLGGRNVSRVSARGHSTCGLILACHETHRAIVSDTLSSGRLFPGFLAREADPLTEQAGVPDTLTVVYHYVDQLRDVLLIDTPDYTSDTARREGDITYATLPWFDKLIIMVDHERWFDRQTMSVFAEHSLRWGHSRMVLFNRTREGAMPEHEQEALRRQTDRLRAEMMGLLEFRRGRGLCLFPPGTFDDVYGFCSSAPGRRAPALIHQIAEGAQKVLNQNEERRVRLGQLREVVVAAHQRTMPVEQQCLTALMLPQERKHLEILSRVIRWDQAGHWWATQRERLRNSLNRIPIVGAIMPRALAADQNGGEAIDRASVGRSFFERNARLQLNEINRVTTSSTFWAEVGRWTGLAPTHREFAWTDSLQTRVDSAVGEFDHALRHWVQKVESECAGLGAHVSGAVGVGAVALAVALVAAPGPVSAITLAAAHGAVGAALGKLVTAAGLGAVFGKHLGRFAHAVREKMIGSPEFTAVQHASGAFRDVLDAFGNVAVSATVIEAEELVLQPDDPLATALEILSNSTKAEAPA